MTPPPSAELKALSRADNVVRVRGGAAQVFALAKGDRLRAIDLEGGQGALFYAFSADGRDGAALLGLALDNDNMRAMLHFCSSPVTLTSAH